MKYVVADFSDKTPSFFTSDLTGWNFTTSEKDATTWPTFDQAEAFRVQLEYCRPWLKKLAAVPQSKDYSAP